LDGGGTAGLNLSGPAEFPAAREVRLSVGDVAELVVRAGQQSDREAVDALGARWKEQAGPVLKASGAEDLAALEVMCREQARRRSELAELERGIAKVVSEAGVKAALANRLEELEGLERSQRRELEEFGELEEARIEALGRKLAGGGLEREAARVGKAREKALQALEGVGAKVGAARVELEREKTQREMHIRTRDEVFGEQEGAFSEVLSRVSEELEEISLQQRDVQESLGSLGRDEISEVDGAREQERRALGVREQAKALRRGKEEAVSTARAARDQHLGAMALLERQAKDADVAGAKAEVERLEQALSEAMGGLGEAVEEPLEQARARLGEAETALQQKQGELHTAKGAWQQLGGAVVEDRLREARETQVLLEREEAELEVEQGGWQLLQTTLQEAEQQESSHLGQILSKPIEKRFASLTSGRYGALELGANLQTVGITAVGARREVGALSTGTVEQLSTLFRLCLAEQLETVVVLDDHLSHTHSERMGWFRSLLLEVSERAQVVVVTCWPDHYVGEGAVNVVDLGGVMERY
jgi:hypothetical protein